jgi:hypothetical protein
MDELTIDQLKELVAFYKQRVSDSELNVLQAQLKLKSAIELIAQLEYIKRELETKIQSMETPVVVEETVLEATTPSKSKRTKSI